MSDNHPSAPSETDAAFSQADVDAILDDPTMSAEEKSARLEELREQAIQRDGEEYAPLSTRIMDAVSMLAQGGHSYKEASRSDDEDGPVR